MKQRKTKTKLRITLFGKASKIRYIVNTSELLQKQTLDELTILMNNNNSQKNRNHGKTNTWIT